MEEGKYREVVSGETKGGGDGGNSKRASVVCGEAWERLNGREEATTSMLKRRQRGAIEEDDRAREGREDEKRTGEKEAGEENG